MVNNNNSEAIMKIVGFITEYNPFHLGHKYHLERAKELSKASHSIAVMSGSFVQRGEPSLVDKWTKAKMAIDNGVDLVIELPFIYSVQSAELFAHGGVSILDSLNVVDHIAFGSESNDLTPLEKIATILIDEPLEYKLKLRELLNKGYSYSKSRSYAIDSYIKSNNIGDTTPYTEILKQSNNILAIEYLKSLLKLDSQIKPVLINRQGHNYNDIQITNPIASATGIRNKLSQNPIDSIINNMPKESYNHLLNFFNLFGEFNYLTSYNMIFQYLFRTLAELDLKNTMDMENGLENRIINKGMEFIDINQLINSVSTKRYPSTRIKRILIHLLSQLNINDIKRAYETPINYIRILASNEKGLEILKHIKQSSDLAVITKFADYKLLKNKHIDFMLGFEQKATDLYYLGLKTKVPFVNMDYLTSPYIKR